MHQMLLFNPDLTGDELAPVLAREGRDPNMYRVIEENWLQWWVGGAWKTVAKARTGFANVCPADFVRPVNGAFCQACRWRVRVRGRWACGHVAYQQAPGTHFCHKCGRELCLYNQAQGWQFCHGDRCEHPGPEEGDGDPG